MADVTIWHDEADRLATWGTLDPPDACMCTECVLRDRAERVARGGAGGGA